MLRRVAFTAALAALLVPAGQAEAKKRTPKKPVVTSVRPMQARVGDTITIYGKYFIKGKEKNTVAFRRDGGKTVFVKADVSTLKQIRVVLPETLTPLLQNGDFTQFRIRVLSRRFGKSFTPNSKSPRIGPAIVLNPDGTPAVDAGIPGAVVNTPTTGKDDCDEDKVINKEDADDDNDLLTDTLEKELMTDPCSNDSDSDGVEDGYEYKSAIDLNDDEYQQPNKSLPYPGSKPYPNPLFSDANGDFDHDGIQLKTEFELWKFTYEKAKTGSRSLFPLTYSDGLQYSVHSECAASGNPAGSPCGADSAGRRYPTLSVVGYERWFGPDGFYTWLKGNGYEYVVLGWDPILGQTGKQYHILDANRSGDLTDAGLNMAGFPDYPNIENVVDASEPQPENRVRNYPRPELYAFSSDGRFLSDGDRDEDADGLTNIDELRARMTREYWTKCYPEEVPFPLDPGQTNRPLSPFNPDSDGDGVRDGADDEDHDDLPNIMELSRMAASGFNDTDDGSTPPKAVEGMPPPQPTTGGKTLCILDKELPPKAPEGAPKIKWHGPEPEYSLGRVNPFNPCLPTTRSRTCPRGTDFEVTPAPFGETPETHWQWFSLQ